MTTVAIIDCQNLLHRSLYGAVRKPLTRSDGQPVAAVISFVQTIEMIIRRERVTHVAAVYDGPGKGFRRALSASYKGMREREEDSPETSWQRMAMRHAMRCIGARVIDSAPLEADDVIVGMCGALTGCDRVVCSDDKDLQHLTALDRVRVFRFYDNSVMDRAAVRSKWGLDPRIIPDVQTLAGDGGDGVAGLPGIGRKGAGDLVRRYGNAQRVMLNVPEWGGKNWMLQASACSAARYASSSVTSPQSVRCAHRPGRVHADWARRLCAVLRAMESEVALESICKKHRLSVGSVRADPDLSADARRVGADPLPADIFM